MATAYKVLGQSAPSATTDTSLYTVPAATQAVVSTITVCNRGASGGTYRVAVRPAGASIANQHYVAYDAALGAKASETWTIGITVEATDVVTVYASSADFSFSAFGSEIA
jgi:hypothetical protein